MCDILKIGNKVIEQAIVISFNKFLLKENTPTTWKNAEVLLLFKRSNTSNIENYRPLIINLLSHMYKLFTKIKANRLYQKLSVTFVNRLSKGFSTIDHIQTHETMIEKASEYNAPI